MENPTSFHVIESGGVCSPLGFTAGAVGAGIKYEGRDDLALLLSDAPCVATAVFTRNAVQASAVQVSRRHLQDSCARAIIANSGCANACTGDRGLADAEAVCGFAAESIGIKPEDVLIASTGVVGTYLPLDRMKTAVPRISPAPSGGHAFARAIMTTDTVSKEIAVSATVGGQTFTIGAAAKGSGMIHPDMGTLLVFITTDAAVQPTFLRESLGRVVDKTFNMVSIDGDTSPSDTVFLLANGRSNVRPIEASSGASFETALHYVCETLAIEIASDGEGAGKLIEIHVREAISEGDARLAARTISTSPLVKAAVHGADPNWGRVATAIGRSGARVDASCMGILLNGVEVMRQGLPAPYDEALLVSSLKGDKTTIEVTLGLGSSRATAWGCDLSEDYVTINSSYTS